MTELEIRLEEAEDDSEGEEELYVPEPEKGDDDWGEPEGDEPWGEPEGDEAA